MTLRTSIFVSILFAASVGPRAVAAEMLPRLCCPKCAGGGVCDCKSYGYFPTCWRLWPAGMSTCPPPLPQALIGIPGPVPAQGASTTLPPPAPVSPERTAPQLPPAQMPQASPPTHSVYSPLAVPDQYPVLSGAATDPAK